MTNRRVLCRLDDLADTTGRSFLLGEGRARRDVFVVRRAGEVHGYLNACPHAGTPLDWMPDRFFTNDGRFLICPTHGALFQVRDGYCVRGPCRGLSLEKLAVEVVDGDVVLVEAGPTDPAPASPGC